MSEQHDGGDVAEGVSSGLEGAGSLAETAAGAMPEGEAREAVETAGKVAEAAGGLVEAGRGVASGDVGSAASGLTSAAGAAPEILQGAAADEALGSARGTSRGVQSGAQALGGVGDALSRAMGGGQADVEFHFEVTGADARWGVHTLVLHERLNGLYDATVEALCEEGHPETRELLGKDCVLTLTRGDGIRSVRGIVWRAHKSGAAQGAQFTVHVTPAMAALERTIESRIYQDTSVPAIVEALVSELLGTRHRTVRNDLSREYPQHEYIVQYQESHVGFLSRLLEDEGITFYFDHDADEDHEVLVLVDSTQSLENAAADEDQPVDWVQSLDQAAGREAVTHVLHREEVGATDVVVADYDWTNPTLEVREERTGRGDGEPAMEVYDHTRALRFYDYDDGGGQYRANDAQAQVGSRADLLDLMRQRWVMTTSALGAMPGRVIEILGCPDPELDDRYLIVSAHYTGSATEGQRGSVQSTLECVPTSLPIRPRRSTPRPIMHGPETATVVGPAGEEIHTDQHGRVKVQFHWDRRGQRDEHSSCWLRVAQGWSGPSWGSWFLPRIGMEVIVSFLGGDPDRPLVTQCVYNGQNRPPYPLPDEKTKSTIKTNSSPGGGGSNELRFEDKAGSEEVYLHAQKDLNEVVEHCHSTHVKVDQSNTVDHDHTETVGNDQKLHVKNDRTKNVDNDEKTEIGGNRTEEVTGHEQIHIHEFRKVKIEDNEKLVVHGNREMHVDGRDDEEIVGGREVVVSEFDNLKVIAGANRNETISGQYNITVDGAHYTLVQGGTEKLTQGSQKTYVESAKEVHAKTGSSHLLMKNDGNIKVADDTKIELEVGGCKIEMTTQKITLTAGASSIELGPSGVKTSGSTVTSSAQTMNEITGLLVKIN